MIRRTIVATVCAWALVTTAVPATTAGDQALATYASAWAKVNTYSCTITAREVKDGNVQDRVYDMWYQKSPLMTRMNITDGDGRGSAVIWDGSDKVYGHKGGFLSMFKKHLDLHDPQATSIRGTTVAEADFGALLDHIKGLSGATIDATPSGDKTDINVAVADPSSDENVTKELMVLGAGGLPVEYDQWEGGAQVKHISYSNVVLDVQLPSNIFNL